MTKKFKPSIRFFLKRGLRFPRLWEVSLGDVNSFMVIWSAKFTVRRLLWIAIPVFLVVALIGVVLVTSTPLRRLLPGYLDSRSIAGLEMMSRRVDSLQSIVEIQSDYLNNVAAVFKGDITVDSTLTFTALPDSVATIPVDSLLPASETERRFVREYEQREKHNLSVLTPIAAEGISFFRPVTPAVPQLNGSSSPGVQELELLTSPGAPVSAIFRGTVIEARMEPGSHGVVIVQHPRNFISVYSGLQTLYVKSGEKVNSGSRIGSVGSKKPLLGLQLWHNGSAVPPTDYIPLGR